MVVFFTFLFVAANVLAEELTVKNPPQNGYLIEGRSYTIRWEGDLKGKVCITVLAGGKDRGIINNCETDADEGRFVWAIPSDFVTGFGIWENNRVRIGIFEKDNPDKIFYSGYFTVAGFEKINSKTPEDAVKNFYGFLSEKRYKAAFSMLNKIDMRFTDCYGEEMHIAGFTDFYLWMEKVKNFKVIKVKSLKEINYPQLSCDWRNSIGVKLYRVEVKLAGNYTTDYFVDVVKGKDGIYRILNIGTSP